MGQNIDESRFTREHFRAFFLNLRAETEELKERLAQGRVEQGPARLGAEVEGWLTDARGEPAPINTSIIDQIRDPRVVPELSRFNLEFNTRPQCLAGRPFSVFEAELRDLAGRVDRLAASRHVRLVLIGILPTLRDPHLTLDTMSPLARYRALNEQVLLLRNRRCIELEIDGPEPLSVRHEDVMLEAAATSLQVHLQVSPALAARSYNAALAISAATVASAANAPALFGHLLWNETRIPLFEQAVEVGPLHQGHAGPLARVTFGTGYVRDSLYPLFVENRQHYPVLLPVRPEAPARELPHLRLHNGTIWRWNRPLVGVDSAGRTHLRIEHRVMSAGPTAADMAANAALFVGAVHGMLARRDPIETRLRFADAEENFYAAARHGLEARLHWPGGERGVRDLLVDELLPLAAAGLRQLGVDEDESRHYLGIVRERVESGVTGAVWQRAWLSRHGRDWHGLLAAYLERQRSGVPVHRWSL
jgi:gamma-glutamyl:cysteine ligase YbdK (ATP-grasp superfamily)